MGYDMSLGGTGAPITADLDNQNKRSVINFFLILTYTSLVALMG